MAQRFFPTLSGWPHSGSQYGGHCPLVERDRRCDRMSSIFPNAIVTIGKQDDSAHFPQMIADFSRDDVEEDTPPSARKFDHVGEAVETSNVDTEEEDTEDRPDSKRECENTSLLSYRMVAPGCKRPCPNRTVRKTKSASKRVLGGGVLVFVC
eukprot:TRINITY_DN12757_c0_g1_i6.p1 TRINITY_DN12757_c0_g1~~TRINITY_DN12757_c0_g1_i6.p1  ORF type:complete len:152 (+),score=14.81 TRINITY_DN12757_c0_g1_i6:57-512(+)